MVADLLLLLLFSFSLVVLFRSLAELFVLFSSLERSQQQSKVGEKSKQASKIVVNNLVEDLRQQIIRILWNFPRKLVFVV